MKKIKILTAKYLAQKAKLEVIVKEIESEIRAMRPDFAEFDVEIFAGDGICIMPQGEEYYEANLCGMRLNDFLVLIEKNPQISASEICEKCAI